MSSPRLRVFLTSEQERTLFELSKAPSLPQRTKDRASVIRLSAMGWKVEKIAIYLKWSNSTVRTAIHRWKNRGLIGLWDAPRSGRKRKWQPENIEEITEKLDKEQRTYNSRQVLEILATENQVHLAEKAQKRLIEKGQITVIVEDQGSIHVSRATREQYKRWEKQGLYIFLLPTYSPELNRIENEWQRIKEDELAGRMFEDEYELAMAVIEAIEFRSGRNGLEVERFLFKNQKTKSR